ncbi:MAG: hypothetical protein MN733_31345, partial [Nitrososphaera sp.]|nr:hypothetical protein [Nitrososphaera sp.]
ELTRSRMANPFCRESWLILLLGDTRVNKPLVWELLYEEDQGRAWSLWTGSLVVVLYEKKDGWHMRCAKLDIETVCLNNRDLESCINEALNLIIDKLRGYVEDLQVALTSAELPRRK